MISSWKEKTSRLNSRNTTKFFNNFLLSKLKSKVSYRDHKRTQQDVFNELPPYLYFTCIVHVNDK